MIVGRGRHRQPCSPPSTAVLRLEVLQTDRDGHELPSPDRRIATDGAGTAAPHQPRGRSSGDRARMTDLAEPGAAGAVGAIVSQQGRCECQDGRHAGLPRDLTLARRGDALRTCPPGHTPSTAGAPAHEEGAAGGIGPKPRTRNALHGGTGDPSGCNTGSEQTRCRQREPRREAHQKSSLHNAPQVVAPPNSFVTPVEPDEWMAAVREHPDLIPRLAVAIPAPRVRPQFTEPHARLPPRGRPPLTSGAQ